MDRPASSWTHRELKPRPYFEPLTHIVDPLPALAAAGLAGIGIAALARGRAPERGWRTTAAACLAFVIAYAIKERLKFAFGRTWPETWVAHNPSWISNGAFGFHPFHGGEGWASFPSGHMTMISSVCAVIWARVRRLRWLAFLLPALVAIGLFGCDFHWISDMVAGTFLGIATAAGVLAYLPERPAGQPARPRQR